MFVRPLLPRSLSSSSVVSVDGSWGRTLSPVLSTSQSNDAFVPFSLPYRQSFEHFPDHKDEVETEKLKGIDAAMFRLMMMMMVRHFLLSAPVRFMYRFMHLSCPDIATSLVDGHVPHPTQHVG